MDDTFFSISKLAWAFLSPANVIILLFAAGVLALLLDKRFMAKVILIPTTLIALTVLSYPIGDYLIRPLEDRFQRPEKMPEKIDGIIVLGGAEDILRSLGRNTGEMGPAGERFLEAARLSKHYPDAPVIFSGSSGNNYINADGEKLTLSEYILKNMGIPEKRIITEEFSKNTYENFLMVKGYLPNAEGHYLLITSAFHMPRSVGIARMQEINVIPYPVDYRSFTNKYRSARLDYYGHLFTLEPAVKEWIGLTVYYWTGKSISWFPK